MASPASREQLKDYALRKLGFPVIDINVDDDQLDDRIDDALQKFRDFHYDGTEEIYLAHQVTAGDISNTYIIIAREHLAMLDMIVTGEIPFTFNKKTNKVNLYMDWTGRLAVGDYIVFQATRIVEPTTYTKVFNDSWIKSYTTALFKLQWGNNINKYTNYTLPGGLVVNGEKIYNDAVAELALLDAQLREEYELPPQMLVG